jgi:alpha-amylase/alpha-mannosidase (GH57 family)
MTQVAILWHMHQPYYEDLVTHEHILPWVRLHALKDYLGMAALMREFPNVRLTFNLVPSLLVQLEAFAEDRAHDRFLDLSLKPATELTDGDAAFIIANFFHAQRSRMIDVYPRYAELIARRGAPPANGADARVLARRFGPGELRDLQVWHKLVWIDPLYLDSDPRVRRLIEKGHDFTEDDKMELRSVEMELLNKVIPTYRELAARGQIELSTSPFYHPILPLLCDSDVYLRTHPQSSMPRQRFVHPEDAAAQLAEAVAYHERLFGHRPAGLWPSEGSVSDAMVPIVARAGFKWMATDELILARTLGTSFTREGAGHLDQPEQLYAPYRIRVGDSTVACAFRDHVLSDRIGFVYAGWAADAAADDLVGRLVEGGRRYASRTGGKEALISIILDGENAWEHFEGGGRPFLRALYRRLSNHPELKTVTMSEGCGAAAERLTGIFPGSWIDANFYIWIGHPDDQRAWSQLADARQALDTATGVEPDAARRAREEVLIAEGSDWFWWYGDDHSSPLDFEFDDLFRRHLRNAYKLLRLPIPDELFLSNITTSPPPPAQTEPSGFVTPTIDGEETSYFEWLAAGALETRDISGAMHQVSQQASMLTLVRFGFDRRFLYVRVDGKRPLAELLAGNRSGNAGGYEISLKFVQPQAMRFSVRRRLDRLTAAFWDWDAKRRWVERGPGGSAIAAGTILEMALPLVDLRVMAGDSIAFFVAIYDAGDVEVERHPASLPIEVDVPDERFDLRNWTV